MLKRGVLYNFFPHSMLLSGSRMRSVFGICRSCLCPVFVQHICGLEFCSNGFMSTTKYSAVKGDVKLSLYTHEALDRGQKYSFIHP